MQALGEQAARLSPLDGGLEPALARLLDAPAVLSTFSRLVIDPNRGEDDPTLLMRLYDGSVIPGNRNADAAERAGEGRAQPAGALVLDVGNRLARDRLVAARDVEESITRIAQKALETGIANREAELRRMEEERRLGYVAITRAKSDLTLCYVDSRFYKGRRKMIDKSRFLGEAGLIQDTSLKITKSSAFKKGDLVKHKIFGIGRVQAANKSGKEYKLLINFGGNKKEILSSFVQSI